MYNNNLNIPASKKSLTTPVDMDTKEDAWKPFGKMISVMSEMENDMFGEFDMDRFFNFGRTFDDLKKDINTFDSFGNHVTKTTKVERVSEPDGKPVVKKYTSHRVGGRTNDGKQLSELTEMYYDSSKGKDVHVQERLVDGKGKRVVKTRDNGNGKYPKI